MWREGAFLLDLEDDKNSVSLFFKIDHDRPDYQMCGLGNAKKYFAHN